MTYAYDYDSDTAETKLASTNLGQPTMPADWQGTALYDSTWGARYPANDPLLPQGFTGSTATLGRSVYDTATGTWLYLREPKASIPYPAKPTYDPSFMGQLPLTRTTAPFPGMNLPGFGASLTDHLFLIGGGTLAMLALTTICNPGGAVTSANVVLPDPLKGYERFARADWDGYGAEAIAPETITAARQFLRALPRPFDDPDIAPGSDATIGLEWQFTNRPIRKLFIDIGPGGVWRGFCRKATGQHMVLPEGKIGRDIGHDLARFFRILEA